MWKELLVVVALGVVVNSEKTRYDFYKLYHVVPNTQEQVHLLEHLMKSPLGLSFLNGIQSINGTVGIMVPPHIQPEFHQLMGNWGVNYRVVIENVESLIQQEKQGGEPSADFGWKAYYPLDKVNAWLDSLVKKYPNTVSSIVGGSSYEGRQILGVKVSYKSGNPGVFIESGIHACEWINVATVTFMLNELLTSNDTRVRNIAENFDWYIFPSVNPDGYVYSHTQSRLWRKNRSPSSTCAGTDLNRNWDYHWSEEGSTSDPCTETYAGTAAFSEVETRSLSQYLSSISNKIKVYLDFHSYSELLMIPYGLPYDTADNYDTLVKIGEKAVKALAKRYGTTYKFGTIMSTIYSASGSSIDWVKKNLNTPYTFVWELRDKGDSGFILPTDEIIPCGLETLDSIVSILEDVQNLEKEKTV